MKDFLKYIKENKKNIIVTTTSILFIILTYAIFNNKITSIDNLVHSYILNIRTTNLTNILLIITNISSAYALIVITIILLFTIKKKQTPIYISINLACSFIINQFAKLIFSRSRPIGIDLIEESGFSYPSGHAMVSMAYFGFIIYLLYKNQKHILTKTILIIILITTIILIGFSRIYLGVHYLSDVIGGFLLAIIYLTTFIKILNKEKK